MIEFFLGVLVGLLAIQLILLFYLIIWKKRALTAEQRVTEQLELLRPAFDDYLQGKRSEEPALPQNDKLRAEVLEELLEELLVEHPTAEQRHVITDIAERHLAAVYTNRLKSGTWAERINAMYFIEDFRMYSLKEQVFRHFQGLSVHDEEYRQSLRACAVLHEPRMIRFILEQQDSLSTSFLKELMRRFDDELLDEVLDRLKIEKEVSENILLSFLTFCGEQRKDRFLTFVEDKMFDERREVRLKAMRSLAGYGKISNPALIVPFFTSEFWEERMYAAKIVGACKLTRYGPALLKLFSDPVWWVRYAAADSVHEFETGQALLAHIAEKHEDAYARDIARHMVTKRGGQRV